MYRYRQAVRQIDKYRENVTEWGVPTDSVDRPQTVRMTLQKLCCPIKRVFLFKSSGGLI